MNYKKHNYFAGTTLAGFIFALIFLMATFNSFSFAKSIHYFRQIPDSAKKVYITIVSSKNTAYVGETFTVSYLLHYSIPVIDPEKEIDFNFQNAYSEVYPEHENTNDQPVSNRGYHVTLIKKLLLIPRSSGPLTLPAIAMKLKTNAPADTSDFFGQDKYVTKNITCEAKIITILPLPHNTDSLNFSGAVGNFATTYSYTKEKTQGNALKVNFNISGTGDLKFTKLAPFPLPAGIDLYNESSSETHTLTDAGLTSKITYSFNVVANYRGNYTLGPINFVYFDPKTLKYVKFETKPYKWLVTKGPNMLPVNAMLLHRGSIAKPTTLYTQATLSRDEGAGYYFNSLTFRLLIIAGGLIFTIGAIYGYVIKSRQANQSFYNYKKAKQHALKSIAKLEPIAKNADTDMFSKNLMQIFRKYLSDKNFIPEEDFSAGSIVISLRRHNLPESLAQKVLVFLNDHQHIRFAINKKTNPDVNQYCILLTQIIENIDSFTHA